MSLEVWEYSRAVPTVGAGCAGRADVQDGGVVAFFQFYPIAKGGAVVFIGSVSDAHHTFAGIRGIAYQVFEPWEVAEIDIG